MRRIPVNDRLRLDTARLILQIEADYACGFLPFCIVATAGTTSSGAIDDLNALASIAERYGLWLHVDGAYGAAAAFSDKYRALLSGIERADSITVDPHKWLSMPFAAGIILTRHPAMLETRFRGGIALHAARGQAKHDRQFQGERAMVTPHELP